MLWELMKHILRERNMQENALSNIIVKRLLICRTGHCSLLYIVFAIVNL